MSDFVIKTSDMLRVTIAPPALVPALMAPVPVVGTGSLLVGNVPVCLLGDELPPMLRMPLPYTAPPFVTPGIGTLTLILNPLNISQRTLNGKPMLLKGAVFQAQFAVTAPAMQPTPGGPVPDPLVIKPGTAQFITTNVTVQAG